MTIRRDVLEAVLAHARAAWPRECCGILVADSGSDGAVTRALRAANAERADPRQAYVVGHAAHIQAVEMELAGRGRIVGYYHSHPNGRSAPSLRDLDLAVLDAVYVIVGMAGGSTEAAAWRLEGDAFAREGLEVSQNDEH